MAECILIISSRRQIDRDRAIREINVRDGLLKSASQRSEKATLKVAGLPDLAAFNSAEFKLAPTSREPLTDDRRFDLTPLPDSLTIPTSFSVIHIHEEPRVLDPPRAGDLIDDRPSVGR